MDWVYQARRESLVHRPRTAQRHIIAQPVSRHRARSGVLEPEAFLGSAGGDPPSGVHLDPPPEGATSSTRFCKPVDTREHASVIPAVAHLRCTCSLPMAVAAAHNTEIHDFEDLT